MIDYTAWPVIGQGTERTCYRDPDDERRCVKIARAGRFKQTLREIGYFHFLIRRGVPFRHLPSFYGPIHTADSIGIAQELIVDIPSEGTTGPLSPSPTIDQYLRLPRSPEEIAAFWQALDELLAWLLQYNVLALGIDHNNVVVHQTGKGIRMILIDGVYDTEWIPVSKYFACFGRRKIRRRWDRFIALLHEMYPQLSQDAARA